MRLRLEQAEVAPVPAAHPGQQQDAGKGQQREPEDVRLAARDDDRAASSGPSDVPKFPPTWNSDWAKPCFPPEAIRATREASG